MSSFMKKVFLCLIGIIAGLAAWPFAETAMVYQAYFPSFLIFSIVVGLIFGLFMGGFFATSEGIILADKSKIFKGMLTGALVGLIGGIIGFLAGQFSLFIIGQMLIHSMRSFNKIGLPISRAVGWAVLGIFIGITEGVRSSSMKKISIGIIGGFLGGAFGGLASELIKQVIPNVLFARLIGLLIFGFFIGLFYGFVEKRLSYGVLRLLNGIYKGKEYLINQKKLKIGLSPKNDVTLSEYNDIHEYHAQVQVKHDDVYIKNMNKVIPVKVNDQSISEYLLKFGDVIKIGEAKFLYKYR